MTPREKLKEIKKSVLNLENDEETGQLYWLIARDEQLEKALEYIRDVSKGTIDKTESFGLVAQRALETMP